ncbi:NAD(P)-dependent oxidoreductase [Bosea sp. (in: a-proteobacteria)]|uniref:NAD-dependent epimerase/dehydratase family protein n=1 Tax=Bosea sp. (in: a-proteobacteria) TaxID=1871050 RepID=UPI002632EB66|nr:NAD(P)-dependent oxidoreductase [Bosea sp. (in: a-proteobacteria)]MCO5090670.1 NAD(P)-dependent oxidoreductase [Bosea sp. (in: a-proteobacteria)]
MHDRLHLLITGASGFVGQSLVRLALGEGYRVTVVVRDAAQAPEGCGALVHSLGSGARLDLPEGVDAVAHLAQSRAYRAFPQDAAEMFRVNVGGAQEMLLAAAQARVSRFCLVSSGTVYEPFLAPLREDEAVAPPGNLGATKLAAEVLARPFGTLFALSTLRLFAPYGPGQAGRLVPDLINRVRRGEAVSLPAEGGGMRFAPSHVEDVCQAMLTSIEQSWTGIYNLAAPEAVSIEDAAHAIGRALDKVPVIVRNPAQGTPPAVVPELGKLAARFDLSRFRSFEDGIASMVDGRN